MPMRATTVRFADSLWTLVEREAQREGVSAAHFIRDATIMRAAYAMGQRGDTDFEAALGRAQAPPRASTSPNGAERRQALLDAAAAARDPERVGALEATGLLDSDVDPAFDRHRAPRGAGPQRPGRARLARRRRPPVLQELPRAPEPWASQRGTPLSHSFCQHAVASREPLIVDDAREHAVLRDNPAIRDMGVVAYAGIPLIDAEGNALGTLCVIDSQPRHWTTHQVQLLSDLAASVVTRDRPGASGAGDAAAKVGRMNRRPLARTGVQVSPLCLGAMMFGGWGNPDHDDCIRIIHRALDAGINFIDTADVYSRGESEEIVGKALAGGAATTSCSPPRSTARWATTPTSSATRGAGSSARSRTACGGSGPTGSTSTRSTAPSPTPTSTRRWAR